MGTVGSLESARRMLWRPMASASAGCLGNPAPQCPSHRRSQFSGSPYGEILGSRCCTSIIAEGSDTENRSLEIGFREEEL